MSSHFHVGEQAVQTRAGVREKAEQIGSRVIRSFMPDQHRALNRMSAAVASASQRSSACAELVWPEQYASHGITPAPGAQRMLALQPGRWRLRRSRLPLKFAAPVASPFLPLEECEPCTC